MFEWSAKENAWKKLDYGLPAGVTLVNPEGKDNGVRFVDLNDDGYDDLLFSNQKGYGAYMFIAKPMDWLRINAGWSYQLRSGERGQADEIPMIVRNGPHPNNGAWFKDRRLFVQNEDTAQLPDHIAQVSFDEIMAGGESPPKSPEEGLAAFQVPSGMKIELVASEPTVIDPVAIDWGPDGRMWVVEMRDYPLGMDGKGRSGGVVKVLEDTKGTGRYDKATVFLEGLRFPNGIIPWGKGVLISAAPDIIYAEDTDGDGKADITNVLFTGFNEGNQQHRINGFEYGLDNWLHLANGGSGGVVKSVVTGKEFDLRGHDLRIRPTQGIMELEPGTTQFGRHRDDWGDWFGNDNGNLAWHYYLPEHYVARNPRLAVRSMARHLANYDQRNRLYPICPGQQRFNWPEALKEVTSACSATPYRDEILPEEYQHSLFICEPANCLVHREILEDDGVSFTSRRAATETSSEFLASADNWCRPVMARTGPDGAVYVVDMYRKIIEHPEYFPEELRSRPDLRAGEDRGRIYRICPAGAQLRKTARLDKLDVDGLVAAMDSSNGWQRDTVQRIIVQLQQNSAVPALKRLVVESRRPKARLQALATLDGLGAASPEVLVKALHDSHWAVRRHAVLLSERAFKKSKALATELIAMTDDPSIRVRYQLAFSLGEWKQPEASAALLRLAGKDWDKPEMHVAVSSSVPAHAREMLKSLVSTSKTARPPAGLLKTVVETSATEGGMAVTAELLRDIAGAEGADPRTREEAVTGLLDALGAQNVSLNALVKKIPEQETALRAALQSVFEQARHAATDPTAGVDDRLAAIRLLGRGLDGREQDLQILGGLLTAQNPETIQKAAMAGLRNNGGKGAGEIILAHWPSSSPTQRQEILNALLSRKDWVELLLQQLEEKSIGRAELGAATQQKLLKHSSEAVRARAAGLLGTVNSDRQTVVERYKRVNDLRGNREKGHGLFLQNCAPCHRLREEGNGVGPDLGTVATKPVPELVVAILDPNLAVDPAYTAYSVTTKDDLDFTGILVSETPDSIALRLPGGGEETVLRGNIQDFRGSGKSLMPEGFESVLKPQDLADLIAYISGN